MDLSYSPHREACGPLHLPSPGHGHTYSLDGFHSINRLRRSLSRSPSRPQRFQLYSTNTPTGSPKSPLSPLGLSHRLSSSASSNNEEAQPPASPLEVHQASSVKKGKFHLRRSTPFRTSTRNKSTPNSPMRRVLGDATNQGNTQPPWSGTMPEETTATDCQERGTDAPKTDCKPHNFRMSLNDEPIKFDFSRSLQHGTAPAKSSPLKRSDGVMNLEQGGFGSPVAKRRSLHGAPVGSDFESLKHMFAGEGASDDFGDAGKENDRPLFGSPWPVRDSPLRKSLTLRKSTLQQRHGLSQPKPQGHEFAIPGLAASKTRQRFSLDGSTTPFAQPFESPQRRPAPTQAEPVFSQHKPMPHRPSPASRHPHPLATALSPSSSASSLVDDDRQPPPVLRHRESPAAPVKASGFSKSLPLGVNRPPLMRNTGGDLFGREAPADGGAFATPDAYKFAKPLPAAFMSTGLISKKNRNAELSGNDASTSYAMPDTPSKRASFPPDVSSPFRRSTMSVVGGVQHEFGSPSTPFSVHARKLSTETFGQTISTFGARMKPAFNRRESFTSLDGDDLSQSPSHGMESQSSNDEFPPTPTKPAGGEGRRSKENSLRSSLFGRRTSLNADTFLPPSADVSSAPLARKTTPTGENNRRSQTSPHTPQDSFNPPDPSGLSLSGHGNNALPFKLSTASRISFPPATPTGTRDQLFSFGASQAAQVTGLTHNDVDTSLTARFGTATLYGTGEFSTVYRVEDPVTGSFSAGRSFSNFGKVWAVKKTKRPYAGHRERERKRQEVKILSALRGHEHVVDFAESWEEKGHLYIQTEFCENGNLKDFLTQTGFKARLDDFRIWKILLELSLGVKHIHDNGFIHLDLKPANVFIDWEGVLKIGDFGLASTWPAPKNIEGEGDREYIGPEVLSGHYDKPADIFALGMIMLEIAGNIILPDNGTSWQRLRAGDMSDLPSLTWSSESSLPRDESGDPLSMATNASHDTLCGSDTEEGTHRFVPEGSPTPQRLEELVRPPNFMRDPEDNEALDKVVQRMISPGYAARPTVDQIYQLDAVQWVERRRRAGATVYEGNYGPADDVLNHDRDVDMTDAI